jgi:periplasmic protein TonB
VRQPKSQTVAPSSASPPRIVDVVFGVDEPDRSWILVVSILVAAGLHASLWLWAIGSEPSLESWSIRIASRVHAELSRGEVVEVETKPAPPPPEPKLPPPEPAAPKIHLAHRPRPQASDKPPPPAQAGNIIAREPNPHAPADLTGETFVTGSASAYAGGVTSATGTNPRAVQAREVDPRAPPGSGEPDRSRPVSLDDPDWKCPWPREAEMEQIDEQIAIVRVLVRLDGSVESASVVKDPGHGFGQAAVACAMRTRFEPARDRIGRPIRAQSPPIRVRFTR